MCNNLQNLLKNTTVNNKTQNKIYTAIADDMNSITEKIDSNTRDIKEIKTFLDEIKTKIYEDKNKAYAWEIFRGVIRNKYFWIVVIAITMLAGTGIVTLLDRAGQIKQVAEVVK